MNVALWVLALAQLASGDVLAREVGGAIVDKSGNGVGDAVVWVSSALPLDRLRRTYWLGADYSEVKLAREMGAVQLRARTDAAGRFRAALPDEFASDRFPPPLSLWIVHQKQLRQVRQLPELAYRLPRPLVIDVSASSATLVHIMGPDGAPVSSAKVRPSLISRLQVPHELADQFAAQSDTQGRARLAGIEPDELNEVLVESPAFGAQRIWLEKNASRSSLVARFAPVGSIWGRFVADADLAGFTVFAVTQFAGYEDSGVSGIAEVQSDERGNFVIPAIACGRLSLDVSYRDCPNLKHGKFPPKDVVVEPAHRVDLVMPLELAARLEGVVREQGTNLPVAGVRLNISGYDRHAISDLQGKYTGRFPSDLNQVYAFPRSIPLPFVLASANDIASNRRPGPGDFEIDPIELIRGISLSGRVLDERGQGVEARIEARWIAIDGYDEFSLARSDDQGHFVLQGVHPLNTLRVVARSSDMASDELKVSDARQPLTVRLKRANTLDPIFGRVLDSRGRGIAGASVEVQYEVQRKLEDDEAIQVSEGGVWDVDARLMTDDQGRFRAGHRVLRDGKYRALARATGYLADLSGWTLLSADSSSLGDIVLRWLRSVEGRIVDSQGRPVAGALVRQSGDGPLRTSSTTDAQGRFRMSGIVEGPAAVFVSKLGYRFAGQYIDTETPPSQMVLYQTQEPGAAAPKRNFASALPEEEERELALLLAKPCVEYAMAHDNPGQKKLAWDVLFRLDPFGALKELEESDGATDDLKALISQHASPQDAEQAFRVIETFHDPGSRSWHFAKAATTMLRDADRQTRLNALSRAIAAARAVKDPAMRVQWTATIGEAMLDIGARDEAKKLLEEERPLADGLGLEITGPGQWRCCFAKAVARVDLPSGLEMLAASRHVDQESNGGKYYFVFDRFYREIAQHLAKDNPADASRVLSLASADYQRDAVVPVICRWLCRKDLSAAERLAKTIDSRHPELYAWALASMARSLAASDRPAAAVMLGAALSYLEFAMDESPLESHRYRDEVTEMAAALIPCCEQVAPDRISEYIWRAVALRPPRSGGLQDFSHARACKSLGIALSFYDRSLARLVLAPVADRPFAGRANWASGPEVGSTLEALAFIDPKRAVSLAESLPMNFHSDRPDGNPRQRVAEVLATHGEARWRRYFCAGARWLPDDEEP